MRPLFRRYSVVALCFSVRQNLAYFRLFTFGPAQPSSNHRMFVDVPPIHQSMWFHCFVLIARVESAAIAALREPCVDE